MIKQNNNSQEINVGDNNIAFDYISSSPYHLQSPINRFDNTDYVPQNLMKSKAKKRHQLLPSVEIFNTLDPNNVSTLGSSSDSNATRGLKYNLNSENLNIKRGNSIQSHFKLR